MSANPDSVVGQGEFHDSRPGTKTNANEGPQIHNKFKPGSAGAEEFTTQVLPAGSAPKDKTHKTNPGEEAGGQSYPESAKESWTYAQDTITGATSGDVYNTNTMGKPIQGEQTRGDKKKERSRGDGVEGVGSSQTDPKEAMGFTHDHENAKGGKLKDHLDRQDLVGADEREPETAERVAAEAPGGNLN